MRCPKCGYISFDHLAVCKKCGRGLADTTAMLRGTCFEAAAPLFLALMGEKRAGAAVPGEGGVPRLPDFAPPAEPGGAPPVAQERDEIPFLDLGGEEAGMPSSPGDEEGEIVLLLDDDGGGLSPAEEAGPSPPSAAEPEPVLALDEGDGAPGAVAEDAASRPVNSFADIDITDLAPPGREEAAAAGVDVVPRLEALELGELTPEFAEPAAPLRRDVPRVTTRTHTPLDEVVFDPARLGQAAAGAGDEKS